MMQWSAFVPLIFCALILTNTLHADQGNPAGNQSYESCGLITGEYLTVLQLISRGFRPEGLKQTLPNISQEAQARIDNLFHMAERDGLIDSYSAINSEYAQCAKQVFDGRGLPPQGSREAHFHRCAGENKVGYEVAIAALIGASEEEVIRQLKPQHASRARSIFGHLESKGTLGMFDSLATELKRCLAAIP